MNWSWNSYLIGVISGLAAIIFSAFFGEVGKDLYVWAKRKIRPPSPEPVRIGSTFLPENHSPDQFDWVRETKVADRLSKGFSFYRDPQDGAKRFMIPNPSQPHPDKAFYMWRPGENKTKDAD